MEYWLQKPMKGYTNIFFNLEPHDMKAMVLNTICSLKENKNPLQLAELLVPTPVAASVVAVGAD